MYLCGQKCTLARSTVLFRADDRDGHHDVCLLKHYTHVPLFLLPNTRTFPVHFFGKEQHFKGSNNFLMWTSRTGRVGEMKHTYGTDRLELYTCVQTRVTLI